MRSESGPRDVLVVWLILAVAWGAVGTKRTWGELYDGAMSDHASHLSRVRLLIHFGPRVWTTPAQQLPLDSLQDAHVNWPELPAMYPVGMFVLHTPLALMVEAGVVTLDRAALWAIQLYLLAFAALLVLLLARWGRATSVDGAFLALLALGTLGFVVRGFYDVVPLVALVLAFSAGKERPERALVWWSVAALLHYRAFFTLPFAAYWVWQLILARRWRPLILASVITAPSVATFFASAPFLATLPQTNPTREPLTGLAVVAALALWVGWAAWRRQLVHGVLVALTLGVSLFPRQTMSWHALLIWPALLSFRDEPPVERWSRYALGVFVTFVGMRGEWPGRWLGFL